MEQANVLRIDIRDTEEFDGDNLLHSYFVLNPDMEKIDEIRKAVEARFDNEDENGHPSFGVIDEIGATLREHFTLVRIPVTTIMW